jgi:hypothetical protein
LPGFARLIVCLAVAGLALLQRHASAIPVKLKDVLPGASLTRGRSGADVDNAHHSEVFVL